MRVRKGRGRRERKIVGRLGKRRMETPCATLGEE
jgi:hypothetical protein